MPSRVQGPSPDVERGRLRTRPARSRRPPTTTTTDNVPVPPCTIVSAGSTPLEVGDIGLDGSAAAQFAVVDKQKGVTRRIEVDRPCVLVVTYRPGDGVAQARLVIHQNLKGLPSFVTLHGDAINGPLPDLAASGTATACTVTPSAAPGRNVLHVPFAIALQSRTSDTPGGKVGVRAGSATGLSLTYSVDVGTPGGATRTVADIPLRPQDFGGNHVLILQVDPDNRVAEQDEANNRLEVAIRLLGSPSSPGSSSPPVIASTPRAPASVACTATG